MSDVFISYSHDDQLFAAQLAMSLEILGYDVWWDKALVPNDPFALEIRNALESAGAVIVIWSETSIQSEWVIAEAQSAGDRLLPVCMHRVMPPPPFNGRQTLDYCDWSGDSEAECWRSLRQELRDRLGERASLIQAPRVALVVGVGNYAKGGLANPPEDAQAFHACLMRLGFQSTLLIDANFQTIRKAIARFGQMLREKGESATGLFYFAGHGMQAGELNYLFPVDAEVDHEADLGAFCIQADWVLDQMRDAGNKVNFLLLDACRDNPFGRGFRSATRGLASMNAPHGTLISYATGLGQTAHDGDGRHSPYTQALLELIEAQPLKVEELFKRVRTRVRDMTGNRQTPWESTSLHGEDFYFRPPPRRRANALDQEALNQLREEFTLKLRALEQDKQREQERVAAAELAAQMAREAEARARQEAEEARQLVAKEQQARQEAERQAQSETEVQNRLAAEEAAREAARAKEMELAALQAKAAQERQAAEQAKEQARVAEERRQQELLKTTASYLEQRRAARRHHTQHYGEALAARAQKPVSTRRVPEPAMLVGSSRGRGFIGKIFGAPNERSIRPLWGSVARINALEPIFEALSDEALRQKTKEFQERVRKGAKLEDLRLEAFAVVREAAKRSLNMRHFDVQLLGGLVAAEGKVAQMAGGEGKTLTAILSAYLYALEGRGVHIVCGNDYLAKRNAHWMTPAFGMLGMSVGVVMHDVYDQERRKAYACDVTYATNNELAFDYLRDNMKYSLSEMVQRGHHCAVVDDAERILIDEANVPFIISGPADEDTNRVLVIDRIIRELTEEHYEEGAIRGTTHFTRSGLEVVESRLQEHGELNGRLLGAQNALTLKSALAALRARTAVFRDAAYTVADGRVVALDRAKRPLPHYRFPNGVHQALEAKEQLAIQPEPALITTVTPQNFFRRYEILCGLTTSGTPELAEVYGLQTVEIPINRPLQRLQDEDEVYRTHVAKVARIIEVIEDAYKCGQPVLAGGASIEACEQISGLLKRKGIPHQLATGRNPEQDFSLLATAGVSGAVTLVANNAGRGVDIALGGDKAVRLKHALKGDETDDQIRALRSEIERDVAAKREKALASGGLLVIGMERRENRRLDEELSQRTARRGEPGVSAFFVSVEDSLFAYFDQNRLETVMERAGVQSDECVVHPWINKALAASQERVEAMFQNQRRSFIADDDRLEAQRRAVFEERLAIMREADVTPRVVRMADEVFLALASKCFDPLKSSWDLATLTTELGELGVSLAANELVAVQQMTPDQALGFFCNVADMIYADKVGLLGADRSRSIEKQVLLSVWDTRWREHLRQAVALWQIKALAPSAMTDEQRGAATADSFAFVARDVTTTVTRMLLRLQIGNSSEPEPAASTVNRADPASWGTVSRNAPCPCGSGKKYKHCHGAPSFG
jgi:preprotein translocase subunit SecA